MSTNRFRVIATQSFWFDCESSNVKQAKKEIRDYYKKMAINQDVKWPSNQTVFDFLVVPEDKYENKEEQGGQVQEQTGEACQPIASQPEG